MEIKQNKKSNTLELPACVDAYQAEDLKDALSKALEDEKALNINAKKVEQISTTCCQILASTHLSFQAKKADMKISSASKAFDETLKQLGLYDTLS